MNIGGFIKNSMIDYPTKISCVLFTNNCNFECPYCHNPNLVRNVNKSDISESDVFEFLQSHKSLLDGIVISGGEPTLQPDIIPFLHKIKDIGYAIKLDTNGSNPDVIREIFRHNLVDYIAMDIKTSPNHYKDYICKKVDTDKLFDSIRQIMESGKKYEFRTTCVAPIIDKDIINEISHIIIGAELYVLQEFIKNRILRPEFFILHNSKPYSKSELGELQNIARNYVKSCIIRYK